VLLSLSGFSQTITVADANTKNPIELATVMSQEAQSITATNSAGQAEISSFKGAEQIQIHMYGYKTQILSFSDLATQQYKVYLVKDDFDLDEVVVSATRWRQYAKDIPSKITSISPEQVVFQNPQTAADMLGISGKVFIQKSQQGGGSPIIRGFATNRLLYTVDGTRMNTAIFRGGNIQNVISLDPFAIDDTEVLFGPGSVIYGSDAIGGVMSFQTLRPQFSLDEKAIISGNVVTRYASANHEKTAHVDLKIGWEKWATVTSISAWDYDHLTQGNFGPDDYIKPYFVARINGTDTAVIQDNPLEQIPSAYAQLNFMQKLSYRPNEKWDFTYGFHFSETTPYGRYDRHNRLRNGAPRYALWNYGPQSWQMHHLSLSHQAAHLLYDELSVRMAYQSFEESRLNRLFKDNIRNEQVEQVDAYSINFDFSKKLSPESSLFYGTEYVLNKVSSAGQAVDISDGRISAIAPRYPQSDWQSLGVYANYEYKPSRALTWQAGIRYNAFILDADFTDNLLGLAFNEANLANDALTGSIGAVFKPNQKLIIRTNLGTAFRAPNVDDIGKIFDSEPGALTIPNPDLEAEYAYNADIGLTKVLRDFLKIELTTYYTRLNSALVRRNTTLNGNDSIFFNGELSQVQSLQNASAANIWGIQFGAEAKLLKGLTASSDLNYQKGTEITAKNVANPSRHAAPFFGVNRLNYKWKSFHIQLYHTFQAEASANELPVEEENKDEIYAKDSNGENYAPAWYTLNLKMRYQLNKTFDFNAGIENITDQRYRPFSSGLSGAGRNFILSVRVSF